MSRLDRDIRAALAADESDLLRGLDEPSLPEQVIRSFRGRNAWLVRLTFAIVLVYGVLAVVAAVQFFRAEDTRSMIAWACGFLVCVIAVAMSKLVYFLELNKAAITRELKRVELQLARLAERAGEGEG